MALMNEIRVSGKKNLGKKSNKFLQTIFKRVDAEISVFGVKCVVQIIYRYRLGKHSGSARPLAGKLAII